MPFHVGEDLNGRPQNKVDNVGKDGHATCDQIALEFVSERIFIVFGMFCNFPKLQSNEGCKGKDEHHEQDAVGVEDISMAF
jgi:hypothetical protein